MFRYESGFIEKVPASVLANLSEALLTTPAYILGVTDNPEVNPQEPKREASLKLRIFHSRLKELSDKQLDIINAMVAEMLREQDPYDNE